MKVAFATLGCKVNQSETQAMSELFVKAGYEVVDFEQKADVYIINTCSVTAVGEKKSRQMISRAYKENPDACIAVVGCYAQRDPEGILAQCGVSLVVGTAQKSRIVEFVEEYLQNRQKLKEVEDITHWSSYDDELAVHGHTGRTRAYVKIQDGCNNFCAYCIIPYLRGRIRSRSMDSIIEEAKSLARNGFKEVVLNGIHLSSYGKDRENHPDLLDVVEELSKINGIARIRLGSLEPTIITDGFVQRAKALPKLCPHFHLSLQSGCDTVLQRMNRRYTTQEYRQAVERLRSVYPLCNITTDIIVGFPGETEAEFEQTMSFVKEISFGQVHVFAFSKREGTKAAQMPGQLTNAQKQARSARLIQLSQEVGKEFRAKFLGKTVEVLVENNENGLCKGLTAEHMETEFADLNARQNQFKMVKITEITDTGLKGII